MMGNDKGAAKAKVAGRPAARASPASSSAPPPSPPAAARQQALKFRTENLKSSYCNMANVTSTREEVVLNFGVNQNWERPSDAPGPIEVDIHHRVILSPFAAKRLGDALVRLVRDYEQRYGKLG